MKHLRKILENQNVFVIVTFSVFFILLFFLIKDKVLFTPDYGESDAYHFNFSMKYFLSESYKQNSIPFWTDKIQGGYPLFSEGQIGALYIVNYVLLRFLPFQTAYTLLFISAFVIGSVGFYLLLRELKVTRAIALLLSLNFIFNGAISLRFVHLNLVQSFLWAPLLFYLYLNFLRTRKKLNLFFFPLILSQMIFAGYVPIIFVVLLGMTTWFFLLALTNVQGKIKNVLNDFLPLLFVVFFGIVLASPQIFSSSRLVDYATRSTSLPYKEVVLYPFGPKDMVGFFHPNAFGTSADASYPKFDDQWGLYWENTPYVGPFFFAVFAAFFGYFLTRPKLKKDKRLVVSALVIFIFILLSLGKYSPLFFLFHIPPFNFFRITPRYLMYVTFLMFLFVGLTSTYIKTRYLNILGAVLLTLNLFNLIIFAQNFHLFIDYKTAVKKPEIATYMNDESLYLLLDTTGYWNKIYHAQGWQKESTLDSYTYLKNYLYPNSNLLFNKKGMGINTYGLDLKNVSFVDLVMRGEIQDDINPLPFHNLFNTYNVRYIISDKKIDRPFIRLAKEINYGDITINLYEHINHDKNLYYKPKSTQKIASFRQITYKKLVQHSNLEQKAYVEVAPPAFDNSDLDVSLKKYTDGEVLFETKSSSDAFVVLKKNYYPNWDGFIDSKETKIYQTNFTHMGIFIPEGKHEIRLRYRDRDFIKGVFVSLFTFIAFVFILKKIRVKPTSS